MTLVFSFLKMYETLPNSFANVAVAATQCYNCCSNFFLFKFIVDGIKQHLMFAKRMQCCNYNIAQILQSRHVCILLSLVTFAMIEHLKL